LIWIPGRIYRQAADSCGQFLEGNMMLKPIIHEIRIQNQVIFLDPPIEYARSTWIHQLHDWLGTCCFLSVGCWMLIMCGRHCVSTAEDPKFSV
jgi:hypothetical protein